MQSNDYNQSSLRTTTLKIEKRPYNEDSTLEEIELIKSRVYLLEEGIIFFQDMPIPSSFGIKIELDQVELLAKNYSVFGLIIDLTISAHPSAATRRTINKRFDKICNTVSHVSFITGKNVMINTAIRFIMYGTNLKSFSINKNIEEALIVTKKQMYNGE